MAMTEARMGQIALELLVHQLMQSGGLKVGPEMRRTFGQVAKDTNISLDELMDFALELLPRFIGKTFGMQQVSIKMSDPVPKSSEK